MWIFFLSYRLCKTLPCFITSRVKAPPSHLLRSKPGAPTWGSARQAAAASLLFLVRTGCPEHPASALGSLGFTSTQWSSISIGNFASPISFQHLNLAGYINIYLDGLLRWAGFWRVNSKEEYQARLTCQHHIFLNFGVWLLVFYLPENTIPALGHV